ncbi:hypothetical protein ACFL0W_06140 [Nanoarchaeota archaeon]
MIIAVLFSSIISIEVISADKPKGLAYYWGEGDHGYIPPVAIAKVGDSTVLYVNDPDSPSQYTYTWEGNSDTWVCSTGGGCGEYEETIIAEKIKYSQSGVFSPGVNPDNAEESSNFPDKSTAVQMINEIYPSGNPPPSDDEFDKILDDVIKDLPDDKKQEAPTMEVAVGNCLAGTDICITDMKGDTVTFSDGSTYRESDGIYYCRESSLANCPGDISAFPSDISDDDDFDFDIDFEEFDKIFENNPAPAPTPTPPTSPLVGKCHAQGYGCVTEVDGDIMTIEKDGESYKYRDDGSGNYMCVDDDCPAYGVGSVDLVSPGTDITPTDTGSSYEYIYDGNTGKYRCEGECDDPEAILGLKRQNEEITPEEYREQWLILNPPRLPNTFATDRPTATYYLGEDDITYHTYALTQEGEFGEDMAFVHPDTGDIIYVDTSGEVPKVVALKKADEEHIISLEEDLREEGQRIQDALTSDPELAKLIDTDLQIPPGGPTPTAQGPQGQRTPAAPTNYELSLGNDRVTVTASGDRRTITYDGNKFRWDPVKDEYVCEDKKKCGTVANIPLSVLIAKGMEAPSAVRSSIGAGASGGAWTVPEDKTAVFTGSDDKQYLTNVEIVGDTMTFVDEYGTKHTLTAQSGIWECPVGVCHPTNVVELKNSDLGPPLPPGFDGGEDAVDEYNSLLGALEDPDLVEKILAECKSFKNCFSPKEQDKTLAEELASWAETLRGTPGLARLYGWGGPDDPAKNTWGDQLKNSYPDVWKFLTGGFRGFLTDIICTLDVTTEFSKDADKSVAMSPTGAGDFIELAAERTYWEDLYNNVDNWFFAVSINAQAVACEDMKFHIVIVADDGRDQSFFVLDNITKTTYHFNLNQGDSLAGKLSGKRMASALGHDAKWGRSVEFCAVFDKITEGCLTGPGASGRGLTFAYKNGDRFCTRVVNAEDDDINFKCMGGIAGTGCAFTTGQGDKVHSGEGSIDDEPPPAPVTDLGGTGGGTTPAQDEENRQKCDLDPRECTVELD